MSSIVCVEVVEATTSSSPRVAMVAKNAGICSILVAAPSRAAYAAPALLFIGRQVVVQR